jgi:hypothetical protein
LPPNRRGRCFAIPVLSRRRCALADAAWQVVKVMLSHARRASQSGIIPGWEGQFCAMKIDRPKPVRWCSA